MEENYFNLIEKYVCSVYDQHNRFPNNNVNRVWFLLFANSSDKKLRQETREVLQFHILRSAYAASWIWGVTLQPSDQIPSLVNWGWKRSSIEIEVIETVLFFL